MEDFRENETVFYKFDDKSEKRLGELLPNGARLTETGLKFYVKDTTTNTMYLIPLARIFKIPEPKSFDFE